MSVLSEKAEKGNVKALENIYLSGRGLVRWVWSMLSGGEIGQKEERSVWKAFFEAVGDGTLAAGDQIERALAAAAAAVFAGKEPRIPGRDQSGSALSLIKFPGDIDAGRKYTEKLFAALDPEARYSAMLCAMGLSSEEAGNVLGISAGEVETALSSSTEILRNTAKELAGGKYNINIPGIEMFADILSRTVSQDDAGADADSEILGYARAAGSARNAAPKQNDTQKTGSRKKAVILAAAACCILAFGLSLYHILWKNKDPIEPSDGTGTYDGPISDDNGTEEEVYADYKIVMEIKDYGTIELELDSSAAPRTVKNFVDLVNRGFYDGLTFHRIMEGFMIQGGDPNGNGSGGSKKKIIGEFSANGVENPISHKRGVISMARASSDYNSASSQFFIVQQDTPSLDGQYAAFGHVTSGMDVVDRIAADAKPTDNNGTIQASEQPVIVSVTASMIDKEE